MKHLRNKIAEVYLINQQNEMNEIYQAIDDITDLFARYHLSKETKQILSHKYIKYLERKPPLDMFMSMFREEIISINQRNILLQSNDYYFIKLYYRQYTTEQLKALLNKTRFKVIWNILNQRGIAKQKAEQEINLIYEKGFQKKEALFSYENYKVFSE